MTANENARTFDKERGLRLLEILGNIFPEKKRKHAIAKAFWNTIGYQCNEKTVRNWIEGGNIDNRALARIAELGGDIVYILTGKRSQPAEAARNDDPRVDIAKLKQLLLDIERRIGEAE